MSPDAIADALVGFPGWTYDGEALTKTYEFADFATAIGFMTRARPRIDDLDHHPTWTNVYNRVDVHLNSHDVNGVTARDFRLAHVLDEISTAR